MGELSDYLIENDDSFRKARLPALYSDFRPQRTLNPDGYAANISAWRQALTHLSSQGILSRTHGDSSPLVIKIDNSLLRQFEHRQFGQPLALGTAVREAIAAREFIPLPDFQKATHSVYQRGWGEVPWSVVDWTLRQLGIVDHSRGEDKIPTGQFVVMQNLEAAGRELGQRMADKTSVFERVFTKNQFQNEFATELTPGQRLTETDFDVLLQFLSRDKHIIEYDGLTIRIKGTGENHSITEQDSTIASIKELTTNLKHQINLLNNRIDELSRSAKEAVGRSNRVAALAALKSKKIAEASLSTRYATLNQLEEVSSKIEQAADQVALVKVMEASSGVLQGLNEAVGGVDRVDTVMDKMREQMADTDEVAAILADSSNAVDEEEIDDELEAMMKEEKHKEDEKQKEKEEQEAKEEMDKMPSVPNTELSREKTPTSETGIANLSMDDKGQPLEEAMTN